jgi:hypothetical protein
MHQQQIQFQKLHEPINVAIVFPAGKSPSIRSFSWENRIYEVKKLEMVNVLNKGRDLVYLFSVSTALGAYLLRFDVATLQWWLENAAD